MRRRDLILAALRDSGGDILPPEYMAVEYIEGHGDEWIDTGIKPDLLGMLIECDFASTDISARRCYIFGGYNPRLQFSYSAQAFFGYSSFYETPTMKVDTLKHKASFDSGEFKIDGNVVKKYNPIPNHVICPWPIPIASVYAGQRPNPKGDSAKMKIYGVKISHKGETIFDAIPCVKKQGNKPGMYEKVSRKFLVNQGGGEFTWA